MKSVDFLVVSTLIKLINQNQRASLRSGDLPFIAGWIGIVSFFLRLTGSDIQLVDLEVNRTGFPEDGDYGEQGKRSIFRVLLIPEPVVFS